MKVKLDENLGRTPQRLLGQQGHDAENVYDEDLSGAPDPEVWEAAQEEGRLLVTLDTDFSDVRQHPPGTHGGILLLRPRSQGREAATALLRRVLDAHPLATLRGCLAVATEGRVRIRRPSGDSGAENAS
jgi:predicted nuclease of predicted toxin-antitoxin system